MTRTRRAPMPDLLARRDAGEGVGPWSIHDVPMAPGYAKTSVVGKEMHVPIGDDEQERVVRAHEMMHAKVSPAESFPAWLERGFASEDALISAEEFRVNTLCERAGFDMKKHLLDGSEKPTGERIAQTGDWAQGVYMTAAFAGTARLKPFISGVRKHNPEWADSFRAIDVQLRRLASKVKETSRLASTEVDPGTGLAPLGFVYTERWAVLLDLLADPPKSEDDEEDKDEEGEDTPTPVSSDDPAGRRRSPKKASTKPKVTPDEIKKMTTPHRGRRGGSLISWDSLIVERCELNRLAPGGLGKKRRASDRGRHPRRIHRVLTDPHKRIFDATKRGNGGVVLIDASGSMRLTPGDLLKIVEAAPGATVAMYSSNGHPDKPNLHVLADKGKMVTTIPHASGGNGCDGPALEWAVAQRQRASSPVVWVCDGIVTGSGDAISDVLTLDCVKKVMRHKVIMTPNVDDAVIALQTLARGGKPSRWVPPFFSQAWESVTGGTLRF